MPPVEGSIRKLWLKISEHVCSFYSMNILSVEHVLKTRDDVRLCSQLITQSNGAVEIQHVLPLLPDFTRIDRLQVSVTALSPQHLPPSGGAS